MIHVPGLDGLRAVAVIAVVLFHAQWSPAGGGFLGVSLFFTLSGFLITTLLLAEFAEHGGLSLRGFYGRRARRLLPAAYVCLLLVAALSGWWAANQQSALPGDLLASVANVANWRFAFSAGSYQDLFVDQPSPVAHFWSLAIEEQIYLVLPIVVLLALRRGRRSLAITTGVLIAGSVIATLLTTDRDLVYNGTHTRVAEVLIGAALAQFLASRDGEAFRPLRLVTSRTGAAMSVCFIGLIVFAGIEQSWVYRGGLPVVAVLSAALIAAVVTGRFPARVLGHRVLVTIGMVSYGIYLFHWPVFLFLNPERTGLDGVVLFALRCAVTAALTVASYRLIEQPVRRGRLGRSKRVVVPMMVTGALAVAAAALLVVPQPKLTPTEELLALGENAVVEFAPPSNEVRGEVASGGAGESNDVGPSPDVTTTVALVPARVVVVGSDPGAVRALRSVEGVEVIDAVRQDCLLMPADIEGCLPLADQVTSLRAEYDPALIVVASGQGEDDLARLQNTAANDSRALNELAAVHEGAIQMLLRVIDESSAAGVPVILSSAAGKESAFSPRLARVALVRPNIKSVVGSADDLIERTIELTRPTETSSAAPLRLLVIGDSTSLTMAQALSDGAEGRIAVLWAGANGCPLAPVAAVRSSPDVAWREIDCEPYDTKLPPLIDSFDPEVVMVMSGPLEQTEHRMPGSDDVHIAGDPAFMAARDAAMASLLVMLGPELPVFVTDFPQVSVGTYASQAMLDPRRLDALNAQVARWDSEWNQVITFPYRMTLEGVEAAFGSMRSDGVHPDARQMEELARATFIPQLLEQAAAERSLLRSPSSGN